jgi:NADPH:quinone reductase-like Zn-dependent oxidoreductase
MRAAAYAGKGGLEVIEFDEMPAPSIGPDDALVAVAYAGLNRADVLERMGRYPSARAERPVPGLEFSGVVRTVGANVKNVAPGDRVCGLVASGAHAELVASDALTLSLVPPNVSLRDAAALPEALQTAYDALYTRARFTAGKSVLVHAVGSSVGLAGIALAKTGGARLVIGTSRTPDKLERAKAHGLDVALPLDAGWPAAVRAASGGVDCILDFLGSPALDQNVSVLAVGGYIVSIGTLGGAQGSFDLGALMGKRGTIVGTVLRTRPILEKRELAAAFSAHVMPAVAAGALRAEIDRVVPLERLADAHAAMEANANFGKILLEVDHNLDRPT